MVGKDGTLEVRNDASSETAAAQEKCMEPIVPTIDISALNGDDVEAKAKLAEQLGRVCEEIGFFVVVNHGIPKDIIDAAWDATTLFFELPVVEKLAFVSEDEAKDPFGYSPLGAEVLARGKRAEKEPGFVEKDLPLAAASGVIGDVKEMFQMGPKDPRAGKPPRKLPKKPLGFADAWEAYYEHADALARRILGALAVALRLREDWFLDKMDHHISALRAINYPCQKGLDLPAGAIRASAHTDYGTLTILKAGGPGLQVSKDKEKPLWHDVPCIEGGFAINLGDLMKRWTNDRWCSTLHRVVNPPADQNWGHRIALAFFHNLNADAIVETVPTCVSWHNDDARTAEDRAVYEPIVSGDFLRMKHLACSGKLDPGAHMAKRRCVQRLGRRATPPRRSPAIEES